jgi:serine/threonine-protein kinase
MKILKEYSKPLYMALLSWFIAGLVGLLVFDMAIMPLIAGHFKGKVEVPDLQGKTPQQARQALIANDLEYKLDSISDYSPKIKAGLILSQRPSASIKVKKGRRIWVKISKGMRSIEIPQLRGSSLRQAEILLQQSSLRVGKVIYIKHLRIPSGVVYKTEPHANVVLEINTPVNIYVSSGSLNSNTIPSFIELSLAKALNLIHQINMVPGQVKYQKDPEKLPGTIIRQDPAAGSPIKAGGTIQLMVSTP